MIPERPSNVHVLRMSHLLNPLPEEKLQHLAGVSHMAYVERGETIWLDGSSVDYFGVVGAGFVKMVRSTSKGQNVTTEIMGPGQVFGLLGILDGQGCPQAAMAVCNSWILKVPRDPFLPIYDSTIVLKERLMERTSGRLRSVYDMVVRMSTGKVEERIAIILLMLAESFGRETPAGLVLDVPLTKQDVADMAGTTVESAIRTTSQWQKKGWLTTHNQVWSLTDISAIEALI